jgi:hypothetical protein
MSQALSTAGDALRRDAFPYTLHILEKDKIEWLTLRP